MKSKLGKWKRTVLEVACSALLLSALIFGLANNTRQLKAGENAKVSGTILSRNGDLMRVLDKRSGETVVVNLTDNTKIERKQHRVVFFRHADMDFTAMMPGLAIEAEGQGNSKGQPDASKIVFTPDAFAIEVAQEQQVRTNKAAAQQAQSTADQGVAAANFAQNAAGQAQNSAAKAQDAADQANVVAQAAGDLAVGDAKAAAMLNQRVSELEDYKNEFEVDVFFPRDSAVLDKTAIKYLANLADIAKSLNG